MGKLLMFRFNIIYTPGNVKYLRLFSLSLLKWSNCQFRIVSNGCSAEENELLKSLCQLDPRFEYFQLPFNHLVEHGTALMYLQKIEDTDYFCFMDSDIIATGDFMYDFIPLLNQYQSISSGTVIWIKKEKTILSKSAKGIGGRFNFTSNGFCLGSTFFSIYDNNVLDQFFKEYNITFDKYIGWNSIPVEFREDLIKLDLKMEKYDTAKLLNIILQIKGKKVHFLESENLLHLGGLSSLLIGKLSKVPPKDGFVRKIKETKNRLLGKNVKRPKYIRRDIAEYFAELLQLLVNNKPLPEPIIIPDLMVSEKVQYARDQIETLYKEYANVLINVS